jgi:HAD superfamily hydrolase (TIGR01450 family)
MGANADAGADAEPDGFGDGPVVRGVVVDLDGTVYRGDELLPGAAEAIARLRERGLDLLFCTNNPTRSRAAYAERLRGFGIEAAPGDVLPAGYVTAEFLRRNHPDAGVYLVGTPGLGEQFREAGLRLVESPSEAELLVSSYDPEFGYEDLTAGLWALDRASVFVGTDPDLTYPDADGRRRPGSGAITGAIACVAERDPDHELGKPATMTADLALEALGHPPDRTLVVGDTPTTDVALGARAGMWTALVLTGSIGRGVLPVSPPPDRVFDSIAELPAALDG